MFAALLAAASASAAPLPGLSMDWNDCPGGATSSADLSFACNSNTDQFPLVCSLALATPVDSLIGAELVIDIQHSALTLPDWWILDGSGAGSCRAGALSTSFDFSLAPACSDAWLGQGFGGVQSFSIGPPDHPRNSQARIKAVATVASDQAVTLNTDTEYGVVQLMLFTVRSTGGGSCNGCAGKACLVLNSILLRRIPGVGGDVYLTAPASPASNWTTWQGTGADCAAVPTRRLTWGRIKTLYR